MPCPRALRHVDQGGGDIEPPPTLTELKILRKGSETFINILILMSEFALIEYLFLKAPFFLLFVFKRIK